MTCDIEDAVRFKAAEIDSGSAMNEFPALRSETLQDGIANLIVHERTNAA